MGFVHSRSRGAQVIAIAVAAIGALVMSMRAQSPRTSRIALAASGGANVVTIVAHDFAFEMPAVIPAGLTTFELQNRGAQTHHLSVARLDSGRTMAEAVAAMIKSGHNTRPAWTHAVGGPNAAMPGESTNETLVLAPGSYFAYCEIPGPDPARHYMKGMVKAFSVTAPSQGGTLPKADIVVDLVDFDFVLSHALARGPHVVAITNSAKQPHMVLIRRYPIDYPKGRAAGELAAWARDPQGTMASGSARGGVTELEPGDTVIVRQNFERGLYLFICFSTDATDGKPHFAHGMQKEIIVK
jgi:hypothetical protein